VLRELPQRLAILGGPIGIEFAQLFARFGVDVTVMAIC
jgi:pyruvate/2-oxoglutarate dehydrogenase complex dihydrolipoamide dehydrogenase (E3) component